MDAGKTKQHTKHRLREAVNEAFGNYQWRVRIGAPQEVRVACALEYRRLRALFRAGDYVDEVNARGNVVYRDQDADVIMGFKGGDRYAYDFRILKDGWQQYDTDQDASYFGCWVHLERRITLCYAEGDRIVVQCPTLESFRAELADMERFYGPAPYAFKVFDSEARTVTEIYCARPSVPADPEAESTLSA